MAKAAKSVKIPSAPEHTGTVNIELLREVSEATRSGGFVYLSPEGKSLVELALVVINPEISDDSGNPAAKTTETGEAFLEGIGPDETSQEHAEASHDDFADTAEAGDTGKPSFEISSGFTIPEVKRASGGGAVSIYPFEKLEVGQFFFIPNSAKKPNAAKDYASTVSSANGRLQPKRFKIVPAFGKDGKVIGANVGRLPDYDAAGLEEARQRSARRAAARQATKASKQAVTASQPSQDDQGGLPFVAAE